jgi:hypothetical protein
MRTSRWAGNSQPLTADEYVCLNKVADLLAVVDHDERERFIGFAVGIVGMTSPWSGPFSPKLRDARLLAAAKAVRAAYGAVAKLTPLQKRLLGITIICAFSPDARPYWLPADLPFEVWDDMAPTFIGVVDMALGNAIGRSPHMASGNRGRQLGGKTQWDMHHFVLRLWDWSRRWGNVTLSNKGGQARGSIVEMLRILKPTLPKQFFPGILSYSFLRKVQKSLPPNLATGGRG